MKESIYTIPISEVFEPRCGCPVCALARTLEERWVQYITGAAMMEPDVRLRTNEEGFCSRHINAMLGQRNRLSVALMLQTRLEHLLKQPPARPAAQGFSLRKKVPDSPVDPCFVCDRVDGELARLAENIAAVWEREESFRVLFAEQEYLCLPHHALLVRASAKLRGKQPAFLEAADMLLRRGLEPAKADVDAFCQLFDYRSNAEGGQPSEQVAAAVERAAQRLCGYRFDSGE